MTIRQPRLSKEEHARLGTAIYEQRVRPQVEADNQGKIVAIDVETGAFEVAEDTLTASEWLLTHYPEEIEAIIDTGVTGFLTLPSDRVAALGLSWLSRQPGILKILAHPVGGFLNLQLRRPPLELDGLVTL